MLFNARARIAVVSNTFRELWLVLIVRQSTTSQQSSSQWAETKKLRLYMSVSISTGLVPSASLVPRCWDESHLFCKLWLLFLLRLLLLLSLLRLTSDPKLLRRHLFTSFPSNASLVSKSSQATTVEWMDGDQRNLEILFFVWILLGRAILNCCPLFKMLRNRSLYLLD